MALKRYIALTPHTQGFIVRLNTTRKHVITLNHFYYFKQLVLSMSYMMSMFVLLSQRVYIANEFKGGGVTSCPKRYKEEAMTPIKNNL